MRFLSSGYLTGVDGYAPALEQARVLGTHDEYVTGDVRTILQLFAEKRFDGCVALDVIEHLPKPDGLRLLKEMEALARKKVIFFTPNGFMPQKSKDGDLQEHLSGWTADEMRSRGYRVLGMYGPKWIRGEYANVKYRPRALWVLISISCHYLRTRRHPEKAAAIYCVRDLTK